jgi:hypothetical protein
MGFCLGAYLAGKSALNLMPSGIDVRSEIDQKNAQVYGDEDTTIQVDWKFNVSTRSPRLEKAQVGVLPGGRDSAGLERQQSPCYCEVRCESICSCLGYTVWEGVRWACWSASGGV